MRKIEKRNNATAVIAAGIAFDPAFDVAANPLASNIIDRGAGQRAVDVNHSSLLVDLQSANDTIDTSTEADQSTIHHTSSVDGSPMNPLRDTDAGDATSITSSLLSLNGDASGHETSDIGLISDSESATDTNIDGSVQNYGPRLAHPAAGSLSHAPDAMLIATNAESNQSNPLNLHSSDLAGVTSDHGGEISNAGPHASVNTGSPGGDATVNGVGAPLWLGGDTETGALIFLGNENVAGLTQASATSSSSGSASTTGGSSSGSSSLSGGSQSGGLVINVSWDASVASAPAAFKTDVVAAVQFFESQFSNPVTINIDVGYGEVAGQTMSGALGQSMYYLDTFSYSQIKNAMVADAKTASQLAAVASLPSSDPTGGNSFYISTAEAKALGLDSGSFTDGFVGFSSTLAFDYSNSGSIAGGSYDFMGPVMHEISDVLGRETMDGGMGYSPLDLFHYSAPGVRTFSGTTPGYFSINGGQTNLDNFNTNPGGDFGDWAGSAGNDMALAYSSPGVVNSFTATDLTVMNVLGWNAASSGPAAPTIASFSPDSGVVGDGITSANVLTLTGTAVANSTVKVYDGATLLGSATANGSGAWSFTTAALSSATHSFTATDTVAGITSTASTALSVTVDSHVPAAPSIVSFSPDSGVVGDGITSANVLTLTGTAEANSTVKVYDGATLLGSATANGSGAWSFTTAALSSATHSLTATVTDVAGTTSTAWTGLSVTVDSHVPAAPSIVSFSPDSGVVGDGITSANVLTLTGTAEANSTVKVY